MGAHALGKATLENSGYSGAFTENEENFFDNQYYKNMVSKHMVFKNEVISFETFESHVVGVLCSALTCVIQPNFPEAPEDREFQFNLFNIVVWTPTRKLLFFFYS